MDTIFGIPSHPLFVHIPTVLLPLAAIGVVVMAIRPVWRERYRWAVLAIGVAGAVGAVIAAGAGESLEATLERQGQPERWESHAESGEAARAMALLFLVTLLAYVLVPWFLDRRRAAAGADTSAVRAAPKWLTPVLTVAVLAGAGLSVGTIIDAGHSGAKSVWVEANDGG